MDEDYYNRAYYDVMGMIGAIAFGHTAYHFGKWLMDPDS
jgi:hypothetical protein